MKKLYTLLKGHVMMAGIFIIFINLPLISQINQFQFTDIGMTEEYKNVGFCRTLNYYWDQGVVDRSGNIHFVFVDNYKLVCFSSSDNGENWTKEAITTGKEGYVYTAMMALTHDDKRIIVFAVNTGFNNGTVIYGKEFIYDVLGAVEQDDGTWIVTPLYTHTTNSGLLPYGMITVKSGLVHAILYKYGWYNYGGELHEVMYDPTAKSWSKVNPIKIFSDRKVDNSTVYVGKTAEGENESIVCMYQRNGSVSGKHNVEIVVKTSAGWQEPVVILENNSYSTYNRFDVDYDRRGNTFIGYFEPWSENGPQIFLAHNSINNFTKYELFEPTDTLLKMNILPYKDKKTYIYCTFRHSLPKILQWNEQGLFVTNYLPSFEQEDSLDVMRFQYHIPRKNNFSEDLDMLAFTNRYGGKTGDIVNSYPIVFSRTNLVGDITGDREMEVSNNLNLQIFPNPTNDFLEIRGKGTKAPVSLKIYNTVGILVRDIKWDGSSRINVSDLPQGLYFILDEVNALQSRFIKK